MVSKNHLGVSPAVEILDFPYVAPQGGSKWACSFTGSIKVAVRGTGIIERQNAMVLPDGSIATPDETLKAQELAVFPLATGSRISLGRFLIGELPIGLSLMESPRHLQFSGAGLSRHQIEILGRLGILGAYIFLSAAARFQTVISPAPAPRAAVPGPHVCTLADRLRGKKIESGARIAILPPRETEHFALANRASLTAWLRAKRVTVIEPETMPLAGLCSLLASASLLILADASQAGLLGLCSPGTEVLEIAPEGWAGATARQMCLLFGLGWTLFLATPPRYPLLRPAALGSRVLLSYEVPIHELAKTLDRFECESPRHII